MTARYGDANINGQEQASTRHHSRAGLGPAFASSPYHSGLTFKAFTRESLHNIRKRRRLQDTRQSRLQSCSGKPGAQSTTSTFENFNQLEPDPCLASGQQLPHAIIRQLPSELVGKPIEDIDPYYANQETFVIISKGKELTRFSASKALYLFGAFHPIRRIVLYILVNPIFSLFVIMTILVNCILMTIKGGELVEETELLFTIIYTTEMGLKVLARGFILDKFTYLRDPWNWLDFSVIVMAYLTIVIEDLGNLSVIRTFRVLRALKTVAIIPGMKTIVGAVIDSVKNLKDVVVLTLFSLSVFSLLGLQIYMGQLTQKCILNGPKNMTDIEWFVWSSNKSHWVPDPDAEIFGAYRLCGNATGAQSCPSDHTCLQGFGPNPDYGFTSFDTFGWALICSFRLMTQDFWEGLYMQVLKTAGSWHIVFFIVSIFLGSIYLMNLILAIVAMSYNELQRRAEEEEEAAAIDEAAFLESCRLMELAEQTGSEYSVGTNYGVGTNGVTSYRPSVEIGLAGQSLLTSLCYNGLLGQQVAEKLNQHIQLTAGDPMARVAQTPAHLRSHSLSHGLELGDRSGPGGFPAFGYARVTEKRQSFNAPIQYLSRLDPITTDSKSHHDTASMSEIRTYNSARSSIVSCKPVIDLSSRRSSRTSKNHAPTSRCRQLDRGISVREMSGSPSVVESIDQSRGICGQIDPRLLKQQAAMRRIVSVKRSTNIEVTMLADKSDAVQSLDFLQISDSSDCVGRKNVPKRNKLSRRFSTSSAKFRSASRHEGRGQSIDLNKIEASPEPSSTTGKNFFSRSLGPGSLDVCEIVSEDTHSESSKLDLPRQSTNSEFAISREPRSVRQPSCEARAGGALNSTPPLSTPESLSPECSRTPKSKLNSEGMEEREQQLLFRTGSRRLSSRMRLSLAARVGGSALVLCQNQTGVNLPSRAGPGGILGSNNSVHQLDITRGQAMHHLSVENFQLFSAHLRSCESNTTPEEGEGSTVSAAARLSNAQQLLLNHPESLRNIRGRLESRGNIRPDTMARSSMCRPSLAAAANVAGYQQMFKPGLSKDFNRRASDWSRMSMSANVDFRRLLRLWSHTNPYQKRPSISSFSNYSQVPGSPACSAQDLDGRAHNIPRSLGNSPRPSTVGSPRQAYELISAYNRRRQAYPGDYRHSVAIDPEADEDVSVNTRDKCLAYCLSCLDMLCIWECCAPWLAIQKLISVIVFDPFTELFIILCILINTLFMALDSDDTDAQMKSIFERGNYFFTATFAVEASMKIMALSPKFYFREGWNVFDSIIVGLSLLELGLEGVYGLSVLRSFRLLRVFKLAKSWPTLNLLISIMGKAVGDLGNLTFVLAIIVFIFAVMGMQLFGNKYQDINFPSGELPRWNFTDFMHSFMIVFRILCAEWIEPMWDCLLVGGWPCIPFFLIAVTVGNLVVLNLFLALLLASFGASNLSSPQADNVDTKKLQDAIARFVRFGGWLKRRLSRLLYHTINLLTCNRFVVKMGEESRCGTGGVDSGINNYQLKSHIATMSKLERLKSIEARTEELKNKIKRSPEHHYHLRQLAQSQHKQTVRNQPQPGNTPFGLNFNYSSRPETSNGTKGDYPNRGLNCYDSSIPIPIIVDEVDESGEENDSHSASSLSFKSQKTAIEVGEAMPVNQFNQLITIRCQATSQSGMQPILEDAQDADICESFLAVESPKSRSMEDIRMNDPRQPEPSFKDQPIVSPTHLTDARELDSEDSTAEERPKSSLYLKAPERQDMEEDDDRALQHIEKYMENCIFLGILCLKWFLFRQYVRKIVEHPYFDQCILALIVISSGTLALEDKHLNERPNLKRTLDVLDTVFTIIFSLEMILKWLAFGLRRYFGNIWSWLDFLIVLVSFVNLMASIFGSGKIQALKTMRTLRAMRGLRPLRALQRFQGMRVVVNALIQAIPSIFNVLLVCLIFWLIFSIMGVQMFGGKFWRCLDPKTRELVTYEVAANRFECIERNLTWANPQINFDNVLNAYLALFQVATFKGWIDIMNSATDSRSRDDQPIREANIYMYFYFVFFVIFGSFFTLNLFIGVIIDNFNEQKKKTGGSLEIFMTEDQKKYYHAMKKMRSKRPVKAMTRPKLKLQAYMFDLTTSKKFDMVIMIIIGLNMFIMALEHYGQSPEFSVALEDLNLVFIAIFTLECLCKIFAMRHFYFREPWNIFDFIVVDLSILGVLMKEYVAKYFVSPTLLRVVRVVKVGRVLRLVKGAKGIRTLLFALAMSLPALFNICLLLFLVMFIYAIFGMSFFMNVRPRAGIDETFNFETFTSSIIVLFQMSTSAGWDLVLDPLMDEENDCQKPDAALGIEGTCGNKGVAIFYLISYVIVTFLIIINMYIAVILENYSQATEDVQEGLTDDDYEMYYEIWQKFDPDGTQFVPYEKLSDFVDALEDPLRIAKPNSLALVILDINIYKGNQCYCVDILDALTKYFFTRKGLVIQVNEQLKKVQSSLHETSFETVTTTYMLKRQHYCARVIQNCWRKWRARTQNNRVGVVSSQPIINK